MDTLTTMDNLTSELLSRYLDGAEIVAQPLGPCIWPVLYMPAGEGDMYPWEAFWDGTRYRSDQVMVKE